jgi:tetratricopeptide (TPR) repeat protein
LWGAYGYKKENDLVRFTVKPQSLPFSIETFTIEISNIKPNACEIDLLWDKTLVRLQVKADIDSKIMSQIDEAMKSDKPPYAQAARYYLENGKDLNKAYEWINKAVEAKPESYGQLLTKARIEVKLGKKAEAIATAQKAKELSLKDDNADDAKAAEAIITEAKAKK